MVILKVWEHQTSSPEVREVPYTHACAMAENGGFYKVQIIDHKTDVVELEL
ncbi:DUF7170 family protein (plasmid) [Halobacteriovorax sp. GFR7]|uniref:DUF7170 family protein n=1 Tax=unclassified Halobacteriovorax TaxID=2639665 RepID=UPI003D97B287